MPRVTTDQLGRPLVLESNGYVVAVHGQPARTANLRTEFALRGRSEWRGRNIGVLPAKLTVGATPILSGLGATVEESWGRVRSAVGEHLIDIDGNRVSFPTSVWVSGLGGAIIVGAMAKRPIMGILAGVLVGSIAAAFARGTKAAAVERAEQKANPS